MNKNYKKTNQQYERWSAKDRPYIFQCKTCGANERRKKHGAFNCKNCSGINRYPYGWDALRKKVLDRDGHKCTVCKRTGVMLHVHHKDMDTKNNKLSNLETKCNQCHQSNHAKRFLLKRIRYCQFGVRLEYTKIPIIDRVLGKQLFNKAANFVSAVLG